MMIFLPQLEIGYRISLGDGFELTIVMFWPEILPINLFRETWNLGRFVSRSTGKVAQRLKSI